MKNTHNRTQTLHFNAPKSSVRQDDQSSPEVVNMDPMLIDDSPNAKVNRLHLPKTSNRVSVISQSGSSVTVSKEMREMVRNHAAMDNSYMDDG